MLEEFENVHVAFLDLTDAFGSMPIEHILGVLQHKGLDDLSCSLIRNLYSGCSSIYTCNDCTTGFTPINRGVRQGCPLSMLLFCIGIDPIISHIQENESFGLLTEAGRIACLAYADDIALIAPNRQTLQEMVNTASSLVSWCSMQFNASKCGYLSVPIEAETIFINGTAIPIVDDDEGYRYLGVDFTRKTKHSPVQLFKNFIRDLKKIAKSILFPWQKIDAYKIFLHSRLIFFFRNYNIPNRELTDYGHHETTTAVFKNGLDVEIRREIKEICGTPPNSSNEYIYADKELGGLGLISARDEYSIQSIIQAFRNITCTDLITRNLSRLNLSNTVAKYYETDNDWSLFDCLTWLNEGDRENGYRSWWTKVRNSIRYLDGIGLRIRFESNELGICLKIHTDTESIIIGEHQIKSASHEIHKMYSKLKFNKWSRQKMAGLSATAISESSISSSILYNNELSNAEWRFTHAARTGSLPTKFIPNKPLSETRCRACGTAAETQVHVLCVCCRNPPLITARHDAIQNIFAEALSTEKPILEIITNRECAWSMTNKRVDLQIYNRGGRELWLIDVKTPYDTKKLLKKVRIDNERKYKQLQEEAKLNHKGWVVRLGTLVVGCLGSWPEKNDAMLKSFNLSKTTLTNLRRMCAVSNVKYSSATWSKHNTTEWNPLVKEE